jgi:hypothetical protein
MMILISLLVLLCRWVGVCVDVEKAWDV